MEVLYKILFVFMLFSLLGYILELFFRRYVSQKKWVNPGFLNGPYLPIYGFGASLMYVLIYYIEPLRNSLNNDIVYSIIIILLIGIGMTLIELIGGLIFIKGMHIRLWDYSNRWGNFEGLICPLFSLIWTIIGALFYFFIYKYLDIAVNFLATKSYYILILGLLYGVFITDFGYSLHLATKIKEFAKTNEVVLHFEQLKINIREYLKDKKEKSNFMLPLNNFYSVKERIAESIRINKENFEEFKKKHKK